MKESSPFASPDLSFQDALKLALQPAVLTRSIFASAVIWLIMTSALPSYSGLIFRGRLAGYFAAGMGIALVSQIVIVFITSLFSSDHATLAVPQSPTAVIHGLIASSVVAAAPADMPPDMLFAAVFWIIVLSSVLSGGFLLLLGIGRAGDLVRYIPYPIVGGFMAALGWLLVNAAFSIAVGVRISVESLPVLMGGDVVSRWLPAAIFALGIFWLQRRVKSVLVMPGVIIASVVLLYAWAYLVVGDLNALVDKGWFLPELSAGIHWQLPDLAVLAQIEPGMIAASAGGIVTLIVVYTLNVFFKASAQEFVIQRELNFNRECTANGIANIAASLSGGGLTGYHTPAFSSLVETLGVYGRLVGIILALMFALTLAFGSTIFALIPRFVPAGLLMFFGLQFMKEWLLDSWFKLPRHDYVTVLVIALATVILGFLPGIAVGLVVAMLFFVLEYSRMDVIKQELSADIHRSNLDRSFAQNQLLQREGEKILILRLQGYIFFATAYRFYDHIQSLIAEADSHRYKFLILDFKSVRGFDVSTLVDFKKLKALAERNDIGLLFSNVRSPLQPVLVAGGVLERKSSGRRLFIDIDHALEWCENVLLEEANLLDESAVTVARQLGQHVMIDSRDVSALQSYLERIETEVGQVIFRQGDEADSLCFIESGRVDVLLQGEGRDVLRLRSMTAGTVVGEVGFYLRHTRSASVVVTEPGILQRLSHEALRQMEENDPQTASALHVFITCVLSDRLSVTNRVIQELMD